MIVRSATSAELEVRLGEGRRVAGAGGAAATLTLVAAATVWRALVLWPERASLEMDEKGRFWEGDAGQGASNEVLLKSWHFASILNLVLWQKGATCSALALLCKSKMWYIINTGDCGRTQLKIAW